MTLRDQLIRDEGFRLKPYRDTSGILTLGVGRNLESVGISPDEAEYLLANDIRRMQDGVALAIPWSGNLDEARRGVLENMAFNLGVRGLLQFRKMLKAAEAGDWSEAAKEMLDSVWAGQVGARATRLAEQMRTGEWK